MNHCRLLQGLIAIHQSFIGTHGFLTSETCLINDRWQVKISDFGLNMIRESQPVTKRSFRMKSKFIQIFSQNCFGLRPNCCVMATVLAPKRATFTALPSFVRSFLTGRLFGMGLNERMMWMVSWVCVCYKRESKKSSIA